MGPENVALGNVAVAPPHPALSLRGERGRWPDRQEAMPFSRAAAISGGQENSAVAKQRPSGRVHAPVINLPQLMAIDGIISNGGDGARADKLRLAVDLNDFRRAKGFLQVAVVGAVVDVTVGLPAGFARGFVQGDDILHVEAVEVDKERIAVK